ncbi:DUF5020 family protein [Mucilaginibacter agri]|uniref:DUF5020 family protein n=1 Tax=Mucilaginibacter agri TaxID=2695265 RepID=UPI0021CE35CB|nr:DUF5020 family protein [Mucilaginibacter agri]
MKFITLIFLSLFCVNAFSQTLQLHYDLRHTIDPKRNPKNFPTLYFEYFKTLDTGRAFIKPGSFLLKTQADFTGDKDNIGKYYMQVSQEFRFWRPKVFLDLQYSGGLGITTPKQYSYYIVNTYSAGISYPFKIGQSYLSAILFYKYVPYPKPSNDFLYTMYFYRGLFNYKAEFAGDFSIWTENRNHGDDATAGLSGKRFYFFAEPQVWYNLSKRWAVGSKVNMFYHVNTTDDVFEIYPTAALRCKL